MFIILAILFKISQKTSARAKATLITTAPYGSITYDHQKGVMPLEWANEDEFSAWLIAEETEKTIKFILSCTHTLDSPNWQAWHVYRCAQEFSDGKSSYCTTTQQDQKIPSMKTGCWSCLTIKLYPNTETILGKYEDQHNHALGDDNLRFLRLSERIRNLVMDLVHIGVDSKAIVSHNYSFIS